jgi:hypothetical protein
MRMSFAAMTHLAEGLYLNAVLMVKIEIFLICPVGTRKLTVSVIEWQFNWPLKALI